MCTLLTRLNVTLTSMCCQCNNSLLNYQYTHSIRMEHCRVNKTLVKCKSRLFWLGMTQAARHFVCYCLVRECSSNKVASGMAKLVNMTTGFPFERVSIAIAGYCLSRRHRQCPIILMAMDPVERVNQSAIHLARSSVQSNHST